MSRVAAFLFPPAVASALMLALLGIVLTTASMADEQPTPSGTMPFTCSYYYCDGPNDCSGPNTCPRLDCDGCALTQAVDEPPGYEVCACVF